MSEFHASDVIIIPDGPEFDEEDLAISSRLSPLGASVCDPFMGSRAALKEECT